MSFPKLTLSAIVAAALLAAGTPARSQDHQDDHGKMELPTFGVVVLTPTKGNQARGMLRLTQKGDSLRIQARVNNLTPGEHGFHIHQFGDLRGTDGTAAGGHYDPAGHPHGAPGSKSHAGDLGNITANEDGVAMVDVTTSDTKLHFILGRAFVVHAGKDDLQSQPSGDAGPRVAVGVVGIGNQDFKPQAK